MYMPAFSSTTESLFIINKKAGRGYGKDYINRLKKLAQSKIGSRTNLNSVIVTNHDMANIRTRNFLLKNNQPKIIIIGGGSGTVSAVINGAYINGLIPCPLTLLPLRMGSGNILAKRLGTPADPEKAINLFGKYFSVLNTTEVCITRYEFWDKENALQIRYGASLLGLGQMGCVPGDISRFHHNFSLLHRILTRLIGIETMNNFEYAWFLFLRLITGCLNPDIIRKIQLQLAGHKQEIRLLAGVAMNFPVKAIPAGHVFDIHEKKICLKLIPYKDRLNTIGLLFSPGLIKKYTKDLYLSVNQELIVKLGKKKATEIFIDEDSFFVKGKLKISITPGLNFYKYPQVKSIHKEVNNEFTDKHLGN